MKDIINPAKKSLFYNRGDESDIRLGQLVKTQITKKTKIAIVGVPDDTGVAKNKGRIGSKEAPDKIRSDLYKLTPGCVNPIDFEIADVGNIRKSENLKKTHDNIRKVISDLIKRDIIPICIGGGNDITHANFMGLCDSIKGNLGVINFDAHFDVRDLRFGITSGTPHYMNLESGRLLGKNFVEFGSQKNKNSPKHFTYLKSKKSNVVFLDQISNIKSSINISLKKCGSNTKGILASFDMDCIKSADAPGTSAPSPNGLTSEQAEVCGFECGKNKKVKIFDLVEVNPKYDIDNRTSKLAASIIWNFIYGVAQR